MAEEETRTRGARLRRNKPRTQQKCDEESKSDEGPAMMHMDEAVRWLDENEGYQKIIECVSEGEVQQKVQSYLAKIQMSWMNKKQFEHVEGGV